jgi:hypothetical protein
MKRIYITFIKPIWNILMRNNDPKIFNCRVCGLVQGDEPWGEDGKSPTFDICDCCGVEFGYGDCTLKAVHASRERWSKNGFLWRCPKEKPPNWSLDEQMKGIPDEFK